MMYLVRSLKVHLTWYFNHGKQLLEILDVLTVRMDSDKSSQDIILNREEIQF